MLDSFLSKSYELSSSDATSLFDGLYWQIMCDVFSKLSGKVLARRLWTFLCTAKCKSTSIVAALVLDDDEKTARAVLRDLHAMHLMMSVVLVVQRIQQLPALAEMTTMMVYYTSSRKSEMW